MVKQTRRAIADGIFLPRTRAAGPVFAAHPTKGCESAILLRYPFRTPYDLEASRANSSPNPIARCLSGVLKNTTVDLPHC
jgi:hypothetical protein